jgi:hypothetical protein
MESPSGENRGGTPIGERARQGARCTGRCSGYASVGVLPSVLLSLLSVLEALIVTAPAPTADASDEDRCEERKRSDFFIARKHASGAERVARTLPYVVIAGLDPAIHGAIRRSLMDVVALGTSASTTGSSPVVMKRMRRFGMLRTPRQRKSRSGIAPARGGRSSAVCSADRRRSETVSEIHACGKP